MIRYIDPSLITVAPNRQRREFAFEALNALNDSIARIGLINPITLRREGDKFTLVAGERRLKAMRDLIELGIPFTCGDVAVPEGQIPYLDFGDLTELQAHEVELEENTIRTDLTWQERVAAIARLAELRTKQAEAAGRAPPTPADIAAEVFGKPTPAGKTAVRDAAYLARNLDNPVIEGARSPQEAAKMLAKAERRERDLATAERVGKVSSDTRMTCVNADCLEYLTTIPEGSFDVIVTDPPYGMGADEFNDNGLVSSGGAHRYSDSAETLAPILEHLPAELFRVTAANAHAYIFCDFEKYPQWVVAMESAGWKVHRTPLIWHKPTGFRAPWLDKGFQRKYECILYAIKGDRKIAYVCGDVLTFSSDTSLGHLAQKPAALYKELLARSARPSERVLDPFCGSGPIFAAAAELGLFATGIELDPTSYGISLNRIETLREVS